MKALTIHQPYAELIRRGEKVIENRTWPTSYRGPLAIHAGGSVKFLEIAHRDRVVPRTWNQNTPAVDRIRRWLQTAIWISCSGRFIASAPRNQVGALKSYASPLPSYRRR